MQKNTKGKKQEENKSVSKLKTHNMNQVSQKQDPMDQYDALGLSVLQDSPENQNTKFKQQNLNEKEVQQLKDYHQQKDKQPQQIPNQQNEQENNTTPSSQLKKSKIDLHKQYPLLSRSFIEQEQLKKIQNIQQNNQMIQLNQKQQTQQVENLDFTQLIKLDQNQNVIIESNMEKSAESAATEKKFEKYLNEQIYKLGLGQFSLDLKNRLGTNSPVNLPMNFSLRSIDSSFYRPENYSPNLSRTYIPNFLSLGNPTIYEYAPIDSKQTIQKKLKFIFDYYAQTYLQPTKKYETFDAVGKRVMNFQSFILFAKDFKLLKIIFKLETIKRVYKKVSEFGKVLLFSNFLNLIETLSHEKQSNQYFKLQETVPGMNGQIKASLQTRQLYAYLGLHEETQKIKEKFSKVFLPFNCQQQAELPKIKFKYRHLSEHDLHRKALPQLRESKSIKSRMTIKSAQKANPSPFESEKQVLVNWQMFRSKSLQNMDVVKHSTIKVKRLIKEQPEDNIYLDEYNKQAKPNHKLMIEQKIKQIKKMQNKKSHTVLENLKKIEDKILQSKLNLQRKLSKNKY